MTDTSQNKPADEGPAKPRDGEATAVPDSSLSSGSPDSPGSHSSQLLRALQSRSGHSRSREAVLFEQPSGLESTRVGHYEIGEEIARGGIGIIHRGRDLDLGRQVAMKVLRPECVDNPAMVERFVEEAQIGGQLQHPGIVPVYDLGVQEDQRPYFSMKLIEGRTLTELLSERSGPDDRLRRFLSIFERICETIAYAHNRGVVHRDLKPANVMIGAFGEVQVVDWGLAKVLGSAEGERRDQESVSITTVRSGHDEDSTASVAGSVLGTPYYMPPEQARGDHAKVKETADVFALGCVLLEILTGESPYANAESVLAAAADADTAAGLARLADVGAPEALIELCTRCLAREISQRPANAGSLANALSTYLAEAERHAQEARIRAAEERRARRFTLILAGVVALVIAGGSFATLRIQAARGERRARTQVAVNEALDQVRLHQGRATTRHQIAEWDTAEAALDRARIAATSGEADSELQRRIEELAVALATGRKRGEEHAAADPEESRNVLRDAVLQGPDALMAYSKEADLDTLPADLLSLLGSWLSLSSAEGEGVAFRDEALRVVRAGHRHFPGDFRLNHQLASVESAPPDPHWDRAIPAYRMAFAQQPESLQIRIRLITGLLATSQLRQAEELVQSTAERAPRHAEVIYLRGVVAGELGHVAESVADLEAGLASLEIPEGWHRLARTHTTLERLVDAERAYQKTLELQRDRTEARLEYAQLLTDAGRLEEALVQLTEAERYAPTTLVAIAGHAQGLLNLRRYDEAARAFLRALQVNASSEQANIGLAYSLLMLGDPERAIQEIQRTLRTGPDRPGVVVACALSLFYVGDPDDAIELIESRLNAEMKVPGVAAWAAYLWLFRVDGRQDLERAYVWAQRAREWGALNPEDRLFGPSAHDQAILAVCLYRRGEFHRALRAFESQPIAEGSVQSAVFGLIRAMAHHAVGEVEAAREHFEHARQWIQDFLSRNEFGNEVAVVPELAATLSEARRVLGVD